MLGVEPSVGGGAQLCPEFHSSLLGAMETSLSPRGAVGTSAPPWTDVISIFSIRGQVLPADSLLNIVDVELIYGGVKYILKVKAQSLCVSDVPTILSLTSVNPEWSLHVGV